MKLSTKAIYDQGNETSPPGANEPIKMERSNNYLPLQEYIEMMKDMRDALHLHKDHLFSKLTSFYLSHALNRNPIIPK